jgi:hypothetical protein
MDDDLEGSGHGLVRVLSQYLHGEKLSKEKNSSQSPGKNLNQVPPKYKYRMLPL